MRALGCTCPRDPDDPVDPGDPISDCPVHGWTEEERTSPAEPGATHFDRYSDWIREA